MSAVLDQQELKRIHRMAMEAVDRADIARRAGDPVAEQQFLGLALELETQAANMLVFAVTVEPTRSVLYRSAASIAMRTRNYREAERLIAHGLSGEPPEEIAEELRDLYEQVTFERHLELRGITLQEGEFQLTLSGPGIGLGMAPSEHAYQRLATMQKMIYRTAERVSNLPFRQKGAPATEIKDLYETYISMPRAASFALTVRLGVKNDVFGQQNTVVREVIQNLRLVQTDHLDTLHAAIRDEAYYNNFVALATELAPDGKDVTQVGISTETENVALQRTRDVVRKTINAHHDAPVDNGTEAEVSEITGTLHLVDGRGKDDLVRLTDEQGGKWTVHVAPGLMDDVVAPNWRKQVRVTGTISTRRKDRQKNVIFMETMVPIE